MHRPNRPVLGRRHRSSTDGDDADEPRSDDVDPSRTTKFAFGGSIAALIHTEIQGGACSGELPTARACPVHDVHRRFATQLAVLYDTAANVRLRHTCFLVSSTVVWLAFNGKVTGGTGGALTSKHVVAQTGGSYG